MNNNTETTKAGMGCGSFLACAWFITGVVLTSHGAGSDNIVETAVGATMLTISGCCCLAACCAYMWGMAIISSAQGSDKNSVELPSLNDLEKGSVENSQHTRQQRGARFWSSALTMPQGPMPDTAASPSLH